MCYMAHDAHHDHLIKELTEQFEPIYTSSPQGVYLYLDDEHKSCNKKFADMLGYASPDEWVANEFPVGDVLEKDRENVIEAYMQASENLKASTLEATLVNKNGKQIKTEVTMAPITYRNEVFVLHFITLKK
jgi:PAS domain S-box-containing protein